MNHSKDKHQMVFPFFILSLVSSFSLDSLWLFVSPTPHFSTCDSNIIFDLKEKLENNTKNCWVPGT